MKKRTEQEKPTTNKAFGASRFTIVGEVKDTYEGKKYLYVTVRVTGENGYYTDYRVTTPKDYEFETGEKISFTGDILAFYNKEKQQTEYVFSAAIIEEVNEK